MASSSISNISAPMDGSLYVEFDGGDGLSFGTLAEARAYVEGVFTSDMVKAALVGRALALQPTMAGPAALVGLTVAADLSQAQWGLSFQG